MLRDRLDRRRMEKRPKVLRINRNTLKRAGNTLQVGLEELAENKTRMCKAVKAKGSFTVGNKKSNIYIQFFFVYFIIPCTEENVKYLAKSSLIFDWYYRFVSLLPSKTKAKGKMLPF